MLEKRVLLNIIKHNCLNKLFIFDLLILFVCSSVVIRLSFSLFFQYRRETKDNKQTNDFLLSFR